jgi:hypothetical protein
MHPGSDFATALLAFLTFATVAFCGFAIVLFAVLVADVLSSRADQEAHPSQREVTPARQPRSIDHR